MIVRVDEALESEPTVFFHQGSDFVLLDMIKNQLAYLLDLSDLKPKARIDDVIVGVPGITSTEDEDRLRVILRCHQTMFLGEGNALPSPARGVVCDLDVGEAAPVAQRSRRIPGDLLPKVYELPRRLLETKLISYSESPWASPIIIIIVKKNGKDIRLCIDYRRVNQLVKLLTTPPADRRAHEQFCDYDVVCDCQWVLGCPHDGPNSADLGLHLPYGAF